MLALTLGAAVAAGLVLGMLGGGGSILTLPILVYLAGMPAREAIAASLVVVASTATVAVIPHARAGRVRWRTAAPFAAAGVVGAYAGGRIADLIPTTVLLIGFGVMMAAAAAAMLRPRRRSRSAPAAHRASMAWTVPLGAVVGLATGMVGAGGGFVIVPVLALLAGLTILDAIGTSLFVIALQSTAGLLGHLHTVHFNFGLTLTVTIAAIGGSLLGARLSGRVPQATLRIAFGWLVIGMAALVLLQQAPATWRHWLATTADGQFRTAVTFSPDAARASLRDRPRANFWLLTASTGQTPRSARSELYPVGVRW